MPGAAATVTFALAPADFAAAVHAGAGGQAAAAAWGVAVGGLAAPIAAPAGLGAPAAAPAQAQGPAATVSAQSLEQQP